jgi:Rap1a immunity proteins
MSKFLKCIVAFAVSSVILASALFVVPAEAQGFKGIDLYKACNHIGGYPDDEGICLGYLRGFTEGIYLGILHGRNFERAKMKDCLPTPETGDPIDVTQAELIAKQFLAAHPDRLQEPAPTLLLEALLKGFHCYFRDQ